MTAANESAEIVDMADARARLAADAGEFEHVGAKLATVRASRGVTLREAAARTHIRESHLEAIEQVNAAGLPARPYALGFVRTYSEYLELDARAVVEQFKFAAGYDAPEPIETERFRAAEEAAAEAGGRDMSLPVFVAIIAFIIWSAWQITLTGEVTPIGVSADTSAPAVIETPAPEPVSGELIEARVLEQIEPVYPYSCAAVARESEAVTVSFTITSTGRVAGERVAGSTNDCFDEAALNALRRWRYAPRTLDGTPKPAYDQIHVFRFARP